MNIIRLEMDEAAYLFTLHIKSDTLSPYVPDSLYTWIGNLESFEGDLWLAREHLALGNLSMANQVFNSIPSKYGLSSSQLTDLSNYSAIANLIDTNSVYTLNAATLSAISAYDNVGGHAEGWAQNILTWYGGHYSVEYETSSQVGQQLVKNGQSGVQTTAHSNYELIVFPNPAIDRVNFLLAGEIPEEGFALVVHDIHGRVIKKFVFDLFKSDVSWNSTGYPSGLYYYQLFSAGKPHESGKIILSK